jgi:hypothetical protein
MEANVTSSDQDTKDLTKMLLYGREISVHMATDLSSSLLTKVAAKSMLSSTRDWFTKSFSTEEGMKVCQWWVYTNDVHTHTTICRPTPRRIAIFCSHAVTMLTQQLNSRSQT